MPEAKKASLVEVMSALIKKAGPSGATVGQLATAAEAAGFKPQSASPAISTLVALGCARAESVYGTRTIYHVRDYDREKDLVRLHERRAQAAQNTTRGHNAVHRRSRRASPAPEVGIMLALGKDRTESLSLEDARYLYQQLQALFGGTK